MSTERLRRHDGGGVVTLTIDRDEKLNAVDEEMLDVLRTAVADLGNDPENKVLVITAEGRYFTSGMDVSRFGTPRPGSDVQYRHGYRRLHDLFDEIETVEKPVVLAAQGPCLGVGVELAVSCDFRLATERATFSLPEIDNLALLPGSGGISRLTRIVGPHWARWLVMAGRSIDASRALAIGLLHEVLPSEGFAGAVHAFAEELAAKSTEALALAKIGIDAAASSDRRTARHIDRIANTSLRRSKEHADKVEAFANRKSR